MVAVIWQGARKKKVQTETVEQPIYELYFISLCHVFMSVVGMVAGGGGPDTSHRVVAGGGRLGGRKG